jgi:hypothetical protein
MATVLFSLALALVPNAVANRDTALADGPIATDLSPEAIVEIPIDIALIPDELAAEPMAMDPGLTPVVAGVTLLTEMSLPVVTI